MGFLYNMVYTALISGGLTTLIFLFLTFAIPSLKIKNNATRFILTFAYFFVSVFANFIISPATIGLRFIPYIGAMVNMIIGFVLALATTSFILNKAKNVKNVQIGDFGSSSATTMTASSLVGAANAAGYIALPYIIGMLQ